MTQPPNPKSSYVYLYVLIIVMCIAFILIAEWLISIYPS